MTDTDKKQLHIHNKSDKPDNVVMKENQIVEDPSLEATIADIIREIKRS